MTVFEDIEETRTADVYVGDRLRQVTTEVVEKMAASMSELGLLAPISVRIADSMIIDGEEVFGVPVLIAGATRLAAAKHLGWETIETRTATVDEIDGRLHEIAENLHRTELTVQERAEHIAEWARIVEAKRKAAEEVSAQLGQKPQCGRPEGGVSAAARDLNLDRKAVSRAIKIAGIAPEAKEAAREAGIADNQRALLKVAAAPVEQQVAVVQAITAPPMPPHDERPDPEEEEDACVAWVSEMFGEYKSAPRKWRRRLMDMLLAERDLF